MISHYKNNVDGLSHLSSGVMLEKLDDKNALIPTIISDSSENLNIWAEKFLTSFTNWEEMLEELDDYEYDDSNKEMVSFLEAIVGKFSEEQIADLGFFYVANLVESYKNFLNTKTLENNENQQKQFKTLRKPKKYFHFFGSAVGRSPRKFKSRRGLKRDRKRSSSQDWELQMLFNPITPLVEAAQDLQTAANDVSELTNVFRDFATPELFNQVRDCVAQFGKLGNGVSSKITPEVLDQMVHAPESLIGIFSKIGSVLDGTKESIGLSALWISVGSGLYYLHSRDKTAMYISGISGVVAFSLSAGNTNILSWLLKTQQPKNDTEFQFGIDSIGSVAGVGVAALTGLMGINNPKINWSKLAFEYFDKRERLNKSLSDSLKSVLAFLEWAFNKIAGKFGNYKYIRFLTSSMPAVDEFLDKCDNFRSEVENDSIPFTQTAYDRLVNIHAECEQLIRSLPYGPPTAGVSQLLRTRLSWLDRKRLDFANSSFGGDGSRPEPVGILLSGPPGTGKTQLLSLLHNALTSATIPDELREEFEKYPDKFLYSRHMESEYWDQYDNFKWICLFDDLGQIRDQVGMADGEWMNLVRAINNTPYALHMAGVEQKGKTFFKSKFVICTTNMATLKSESIFDMDAVKRRLHIKVEVAYNPKFSTVNKDGSVSFDGSKLPDGKFTEEVPLLMLVEGENKRMITFKQLVDMSLLLYKKQQLRYQQMVERRTFVRAAFQQYTPSVPESVCTQNSKIPLRVDSTGRLCPDSEITDCDFNFVDGQRTEEECKLYKLVNPDATHADYLNWRTGDSGKYYYYQIGWNISDHLHQVTKTVNSMDLTHIRDVVKYLEVDKDFKTFILTFERKFALNTTMWNVPYTRMAELCDFTQDHNPELLDLTFSALFGFYNMFKDRDCIELFFNSSSAEWNGLMEEYCANPIRLLSLRIGVSYPRRKLQDVKDSINAYMCDPNNSTMYNIVQWMYKASKIVGVIGLCTAMYHLYQRVFGKDTISVDESQSFGHSDRMHSNSAQKLKHLRDTIAKTHPQMAAHFDPSCTDVALKICKRNVYEFIAQNADGMKSSGFCTFVADRFLLLPSHFLTTLAEGCVKNPEVLKWKIELKNHTSGDSIFMTFSDFIFADNVMKDESDLALLLLPKTITQEHPNILGHFLKENDLKKIKDVNVLIPRPGLSLELHTAIGTIIKQLPMSSKNDPSGIHYIHDILRYQGPFTKGDCGRPAFFMHRNSQWGVFAGIHVAGNVRESFGASALISFEEIETMINELALRANPVMEEQMLATEIPDSFALVRTTSKPVLTNARSKIRRSKIYGMWGDAKTTHSRLRPYYNLEGELVDPFKLALVKYASPPIVLPINELDCVARWYGDWLSNVSPHDNEGRVLTFEEAVLGLEGHRFFSGIKRNTSPGYPFIHESLYHGRGCFPIFGEGQEFDLTTRACIDLKNRVMDMIQKAKIGVRSEVIYTDNLKDERVDIEKWRVGKTRLFSGSPEHYKIAFRMYFGQFSEWFAMNHSHNGSAIGVNPYSKDWHVVAQNLRRVGGVERAYGAGDYSGFDGSEKPEVHNMILRIINNWYNDRGGTPSDNMVRTILWKDITNSRHIRFNVIYEWFSSLPSGNPLTAIVNTMYNNICIRYCWLRMMQKHFPEFSKDLIFSEFNENVYFIALGDDNLFAVGPLYRKYFTESTISEWMLEIGMKYTSETKDCTNEALRNLEDVEFLKRSFRYDNVLRRWLAPLRLSVVLEIPYWTKEVPGQKDSIAGDNVQEALNELSLYPEEIFYKWSTKIVHAYRTMYGKNPIRRDFVNCKEFTLNLDEFWF